MKIYVFIAILASVYAAEVKKETSTQAAPAAEQNKDKRQTQGEIVIAAPAHLVYRTSRRQQEQVAPVQEPQEGDKPAPSNRLTAQEYRRGQVFSLNAHELLELQPERKAPIASGQHLQELYSTDPAPEHKQNIQQFYILEPQYSRQVSLQPSHAVITRPAHSANVGEASVGAALSVSDASSSESFDQELLALLGHSPVRTAEEPRVQAYTAVPQVASQNAAPQYSQVERYSKPTKKATKLRPKVQYYPPQQTGAPQQYLIETTNVQQQQQQQHQQQQQQQQPQLQYRPHQQARPAQSLRYVSIPTPQPTYYPVPENQGIKIVAAPNLQQQRGQVAYRLIPQYQQPEAAPKQYRIIEAPRQLTRPEVQRIPASSIDRPITYIKRYPDLEKTRAVKVYDQSVGQEGLGNIQQSAQVVGDHYYIRPIYRATDQRGRYQLAQLAVGSMDQGRTLEPTKSPHSAIYVNKNVTPKKVGSPLVRIDQPVKIDQHSRVEKPSRQEQQVNVEINGQSLEEQRSHLPPPRNNKAYTPEEFAALVSAGYSVTPIPVTSVRNSSPVQYAQSRSSVEPLPAPTHRRPLYSRRHQYLPLRGDDAP